MPLHICPVCGTAHLISAGQQPFAYGHPLCCSPACKQRYRQIVRARILAQMQAAQEEKGEKQNEGSLRAD